MTIAIDPRPRCGSDSPAVAMRAHLLTLQAFIRLRSDLYGVRAEKEMERSAQSAKAQYRRVQSMGSQGGGTGHAVERKRRDTLHITRGPGIDAGDSD